MFAPQTSIFPIVKVPHFIPRPADRETKAESLGATQRVGAAEGSGGGV